MAETTASQRGRSSRNKGFAFERRVANDLRESGLCPDAKRGFQTRGGTSEEADVKNTGRVFFECKAHKRVDKKAAFLQAFDNCADGQIPVAVCKDDYRPIVAVLPLYALNSEMAPDLVRAEQCPLVEIKWEWFLQWVLPMLLAGEESEG